MSRYVALIDGKAGAYGVVVPDLPAVRRPAPRPMKPCATRSRRCGFGLKTLSRTASGCRDHATPRNCGLIPKWRKRLRMARRWRSCRCCSMLAGPPRPTCPSMQGCSPRSTTRRRSTGSPVRPFSPARRERRSQASTPNNRPGAAGSGESRSAFKTAGSSTADRGLRRTSRSSRAGRRNRTARSSRRRTAGRSAGRRRRTAAVQRRSAGAR